MSGKTNAAICVFLMYCTLLFSSEKEEKQYPEISGEKGVINKTYPPGDVRRYGVFPDGKTNWERDTAYISNIYKNASELGIEIFWPSGYYRTGLNLSKSNVTFRFGDGVEFAGIIHIISSSKPTFRDKPVENITFKGTCATYTRFGTINLRNFKADRIICKSNPEKEIMGWRGRGAHIYFGCMDWDVKEIIVEKGSSQDDTKNMHAAVSIDGARFNPARLKIGRILVKDSRVHGVYISGNDHEIGEIIVEGYGDGVLKECLQDARPEESAEAKGVWFNRASGHVGKIVVNQPSDGETARAQDTAQVCFDQGELLWDTPGASGKWTANPKGMTVDSISCGNVRKYAVTFGSYGDKSYAKAGEIEFSLSTSNKLSGNPSLKSSDNAVWSNDSTVTINEIRSSK